MSEIKVETNKVAFIGNKCLVEFRMDKKEISGRDLTDQWNLPAFYNQTKRSIKRALTALQAEFNDNTTMYQAMDIICKNGVRCRSYCMMD